MHCLKWGSSSISYLWVIGKQSISWTGATSAVSDCCGEENVFDLPVHQRSNPHLCSWDMGNDWKSVVVHPIGNLWGFLGLSHCTLTRVTVYLLFPRNTSVSLKRNCKVLLEWTTYRIPCLACCHCNTTLDNQKIIDGWINGWMFSEVPL